MTISFKNLREKAELSTDKAIELLDISKSHLYKIEQGYRQPSISLIRKMALIYNCTIGQIFLALNITDSDRETS